MLNPLSLLSPAISAVTGFFGSFKTYLIIGTVTLAVGAASGAWVGYRMESGKVAAIQAADAEAETQATQLAAFHAKAEDKVALDAAVHNQTIEGNITLQVAVNAKEITLYVHDQISCPGPTVGLARVLRSYAAGIDASTLSLAPGQSDDDCSDVTASEVASWFNSYAGAARQNSQQLNDLEDWIAKDHAAQESKQ
jgi:hypothetical protein